MFLSLRACNGEEFRHTYTIEGKLSGLTRHGLTPGIADIRCLEYMDWSLTSRMVS